MKISGTTTSYFEIKESNADEMIGFYTYEEKYDGVHYSGLTVIDAYEDGFGISFAGRDFEVENTSTNGLGYQYGKVPDYQRELFNLGTFDISTDSLLGGSGYFDLRLNIVIEIKDTIIPLKNSQEILEVDLDYRFGESSSTISIKPWIQNYLDLNPGDLLFPQTEGYAEFQLDGSSSSGASLRSNFPSLTLLSNGFQKVTPTRLFGNTEMIGSSSEDKISILSPANSTFNGIFATNLLGYFASPCESIVKNAVTVYPTSFVEKRGIYAEFKPNGGLDLRKAAKLCGYDHFNWLNLVIRDDPPSVSTNRSRTGSFLRTPYLDPPLGGYGYVKRLKDGTLQKRRDGRIKIFKAKTGLDDYEPYYYDEKPNSPDSLGYIGNRIKRNPTSSIFTDQPDPPQKVQSVDFLLFLVGVNADKTGEILYSIPWSKLKNGDTSVGNGSYRSLQANRTTKQSSSITREFDPAVGLSPSDIPVNVRGLLNELGIKNASGQVGSPVPPIDFTRSPIGLKKRGTNSSDIIQGKKERDILQGKKGNDQILGKQGDDSLFGDTGKDILKGQEGKDQLKGGDGTDLLIGGEDRDSLQGDAGSDRLLGQGDNDILIGGKGNDTLIGGSGSDVFLFQNLTDGVDTITDFTPTVDLIDLSSIFSKPEFANIDLLTDFINFIQITELESGSQIAIDADGVGSGTQFIPLVQLLNASADTITLGSFIVG